MTHHNEQPGQNDKLQSQEDSPDDLIRSAVKKEKGLNDAKLGALKDLYQKDPQTVQQAFARVYKHYEGKPEMQQDCLKVAQEMGINHFESLEVANHVLYSDPKDNLT